MDDRVALAAAAVAEVVQAVAALRLQAIKVALVAEAPPLDLRFPRAVAAAQALLAELRHRHLFREVVVTDFRQTLLTQQ